ncbi:uncharacterized protein EV420DRAFT_993065 [Desarmillaria tabescens]|uniref:F-box domain-containing protein n=1 Tax=Armillaria tabescens TaxID=1929756 RepID=A0AA39JMU4_ARMTA|nr:uncharacterized protein EV420DRAFT_993065 [Desarmillaria tabescens]KAK0444596.1 hypothetical protein EV420DRAFT_993065 [Desarmillaria tabescens]
MPASEFLLCTGCDCPNHFMIPSSHSETSPSPIGDISSRADLAHLKKSNEAPSDNEAVALRGIISSCKKRIDSLTKEKSALENFVVDLKRHIHASKQKIIALQNERLQVDAQIHEWQPLLNPIRYVPPEIWSRIFNETIEFPTFPRASWNLDPHTGALSSFRWHLQSVESSLWAIEDVCNKWRNVVLNSPELWSFINIVINDSNFGPNAHRYTRRLGRQLGRTGKRPLSIIISCLDPSIFDGLPSQLTMMLCTFSDSIRYLRLYLPSRMIKTIPSLGLPLPSLQTLFILSTDTENINERLELFPFCPKLRELEFVDIDNPSRSFSLPWQQVTDYRCWSYRNGGPGASTHILSLEQMICLQDCFLQCGLTNPFSNGAGLPSLRRAYRLLDLRSHEDGGETAIQQIMDRLTLPILLQLKVACSAGNTPSFMDGAFAAIRHLIDRSGPPLTLLHFCGARVAVKDLLHIIRSTPTLEDLQLTELRQDTITPELVHALMLNPASGVINVPRLHTLHLSGVTKSGVSLLVDMICSRWILDEGLSKHVSRLKLVKVDSDYDFLEHYSRMTVEPYDISQWIKDGLACEFS